MDDQIENRASLWGAMMYPKLVNLWRTGIGLDVTIVCQDGSIKVPSVLLCALSEKLHEVLVTSKDNTLTFLNVDYKFWDDLMTWVYAGMLPDQMLFQENLPVLFSTLLVAHSLGMNEVLSLYKHLCQVGKTGPSVSTLWNSFDNDIKMDVQMQYLNSNDELTSVCFTSAVMSELKDPLQCSPFSLENRCLVRHSDTMTEEICICCEKSCQSEIVQCIYCQKLYNRSQGKLHMQQDHGFCLSILWPYSCQIFDHDDKQVVKGSKVISKNTKNKLVFKYECKICHQSFVDLFEFVDHFLVHGFFPKMCFCCGDIFANEGLKNQHLQYCRLRTTEEESLPTVYAELMDSNTGPMQNDMDELFTYQNQLTSLSLSDVLNSDKPDQFQKRCMSCGDICAAKKVVCLFCNCVTSNDINHMITEHSECKKAKIWAYNCDLQRIDKTEEIVRRVVNEQGGYLYECKICHQHIENKEGIFFHIRNVHKITSLFHCSHCESGFKSSALRSYHQYLCGGGIFMRCTRCSFYGSREDIRIHSEEMHMSAALSVLKRKKVMTKQPKKPSIGGFKDRRGTSEREQDGSMCFACQIHCPAVKVKCVYCFKVVTNDRMHMETDHPYATEAAQWVYTCKYLARQIVKTKQWVLFFKEPIDVTDKSKYHYRCTKCQKTFPTLEKVKKHTKVAHHGYVKSCKYCHMGFASFVHHKDHEHFCGGGGLISCEICHRNVGCYRSLYDHQTKWHTEVEKRTLKGKPIDYSSEEDVGAESQDDDEAEQEDEAQEEQQNFEEEFIEEEEPSNIEMPLLKSSCCYCGKPCKKKKVRCVYCGSVCENDLSHKEAEHPFTPDDSMWVYTCHFQMEASAPNKDWVVCAKEPSTDPNVETFKCVKCNLFFCSQNDVKEHVEESHGIIPKFCEVCEMGFAKQNQMKDHVHFCKGGNLLSCDICSEFLGTYCLFEHHMSTQHPDFNELNDNFVSNVQVKKEKQDHLDKHKSLNRSSFCFDCGDHCKAQVVQCAYCYKVVENSKSHMDKHHMFSPDSCAWLYRCQYATTMADESQKWMASAKELVSPDESNQLSSQHRCSYCDLCLPDLDSMLSHIKEDHGITHPVKVCGVCDAVFLKFSYWKDHFHFCSGGDILMCDLCGKKLGGHRALSEHKCPGESKQFSEMTGDLSEQFIAVDVKQEISLEHRESDNAETGEIDEILPYFYEEKTTQSTVHPKRCFSCGDYCTSVMVKCMLCQDTVIASDNHMEKVHPEIHETAVWPVSCNIMNEPISSTNVSDVLYREADGIENLNLKVYHCLLCQEYCDTSMELSQHTQQAHNFELHVCNVCGIGFDTVMKQKNHQHFCGGGDLLKCSLCEVLVGSWTNANTHFHLMHKPQSPEQGSKRKLDTSESPVKRAKIKMEKIVDITKHDLEIPRGLKIKCMECEFQSPSLLDIDTHNKTTHGYKSNELGQICHFCFRLFKSRSAREKHEQHNHLGSQRVFCEKCGRDFEIPMQREIHVKYYHKDE